MTLTTTQRIPLAGNVVILFKPLGLASDLTSLVATYLPGDHATYWESTKRNILTLCRVRFRSVKVIINISEIIFLKIFTSRAATINERYMIKKLLELDSRRRQWHPHSSTLAWKIPWAEEPGRLQSMGSQRVGHDWPTWLSLFTSMHWRRKGQPTPVFLPGEPQGRQSLVGCCLRGHTESDTTDAT